MYEKRHMLIRVLFNDTLHLPGVGKASVLEVIGLFAIPAVVLVGYLT